jgi:hypothetical protein
MENKLTGFDLLLFLSNNLMHIQSNPEGNGFDFIATPELSEALSENVGFPITVDVLQQILAQFAEYGSQITIELSPNDGEVQ